MSVKYGAIVARFQVSSLHEGHIHLIDSVKKECGELVILLGEPSNPNERNPLSFNIRKQMILEKYPSTHIFKIKDHHEDSIWSENLDKILETFGDITLFGSRDSFISFYTGKFPYKEIPELVGFSGTDTRNKILDFNDPTINNEYFRMGIIYGFNQALANHKCVS